MLPQELLPGNRMRLSAWRQPSAESGSPPVWFRARREYMAMGSEAPQFLALTQLRLEVGKGKAGQRQI